LAWRMHHRFLLGVSRRLYLTCILRRFKLILIWTILF
jgi:hypothetical protein